MTENFEASPYPSEHDVEKISLQTGLDRRVIIIWFQNRRSKYKKRIPESHSQISKSPEKNNITNNMLIEENNHNRQTTTAQKILLNFSQNNNSIEEPNSKRSKIEETTNNNNNNNSNTNSLTATMMSWINEQAQT